MPRGGANSSLSLAGMCRQGRGRCRSCQQMRRAPATELGALITQHHGGTLLPGTATCSASEGSSHRQPGLACALGAWGATSLLWAHKAGAMFVFVACPESGHTALAGRVWNESSGGPTELGPLTTCTFSCPPVPCGARSSSQSVPVALSRGQSLRSLLQPVLNGARWDICSLLPQLLRSLLPLNLGTQLLQVLLCHVGKSAVGPKVTLSCLQKLPTRLLGLLLLQDSSSISE